MGTSGNIMVTTNGGKKEISGFKYYTAPVFQLKGKCIYYVLDPILHVLKDTSESISLQFLQMNRYDSIKNYFDDPYLKINISPYVDSPNYIRLSGIIVDPNDNSLATFQTGSNLIVYAKLIDTILTIPIQYPIPTWDLEINGSGTLINNKLTLNYKSKYRLDYKISTVTTQ
jgi:hypothetical protein